jgi:hypothetical protein
MPLRISVGATECDQQALIINSQSPVVVETSDMKVWIWLRTEQVSHRWFHGHEGTKLVMYIQFKKEWCGDDLFFRGQPREPISHLPKRLPIIIKLARVIEPGFIYINIVNNTRFNLML